MKYPNLCIVACMLFIMACQKDKKTIIHTGGPLTLEFTFPLLGSGEMNEVYNGRAPLFVIKNATQGVSYSFSITGDANTSIFGNRYAEHDNGIIEVFLPYNGALTLFKDGELKVFVDTGFIAERGVSTTCTKEEFVVRDCRDFMAMGFFDGTHPGNVYVQANDFAFPDTVFHTCPTGEKYGMYGTYDGQGHKITNLSMYSNDKSGTVSTSLALFRWARTGAVIKNVQVEYAKAGISVGADVDHVIASGLIGFCDTCTIINSSVKGDFSFANNAIDKGQAAGLAYTINNGSVIGCSYTGTVNNVYFAGLSLSLRGQMNMCYANYSYTGPYTAGLVLAANGDGNLNNWGIANSYAYINTTAGADLVLAITPSLSKLNMKNVYANYGSEVTDGITLLPSLTDMNTALTALTVRDWPADVPVATGNKPFVANGGEAAKLWWQ